LRPAQAAAWVFGVHCAEPPQRLGWAAPQTAGETQLPHGIEPPQPSAIGPHAFAGHVVIGTQLPVPPSVTLPPPQTFGMPPPPQIVGAAHVVALQLTMPPQPSEMLPQFMPAGHAVIFVHEGVPHWFGVPPPPQIAPPMQLPAPQSTVPPQPSAMMPHEFALHAAFVRGTHGPPLEPVMPPPPHLLGVPPPPQTCGAVQPPQSVVTPPQPSGCGPHVPG
jgi:hypothetical protein